MPATEIAEIEARLKDQDVRVVDVEFEGNLCRLFAFVRAMNEQGDAVDRTLQVEFCEQLRFSAFLFKNNIAHAYKRRYRDDTGGQILIDIAQEGVTLLDANTDEDRSLLFNARRALGEIKRVNDALFAPQPEDFIPG